MLSSPGEIKSLTGRFLFSMRTIGRKGEVSCSSSSGVGSQYFLAASKSFTITAKGFCFLPYHSLMRAVLSRVQQMCIPPQLLAMPILPSRSIFAKVAMGSPSMGSPFFPTSL